MEAAVQCSASSRLASVVVGWPEQRKERRESLAPKRSAACGKAYGAGSGAADPNLANRH